MNRKRDWTKYNQSLINRGSLTIWIEDSLSQEWMIQPKIGRPKFSSHVIKMALFLREVFKLPLRALQGFITSILQLLKLPLKAPHYTLLCKRYKEVADSLPNLSSRRPHDLVIDSSGFKIYGEGEWKVKIHGPSKRRRWIKLHLAVDPKSQEIIVAIASNDITSDKSLLPNLVDAAPGSVKRVAADGGYDYRSCREFLYNKGIETFIPPRKNACYSTEDPLVSRNEAIEIIKLLGGDAQALSLWKKSSGYSMRSLVETTFSRLKKLFGDRLRSGKFDHQKAEALIRCYVLNRMTQLSSIK